MTIRYTLTPADYVAIQTHFQQRSGILANVGRRLAPLLVLFVAAVTLVVVPDPRRINFAGLALLIVAVLGVAFFIGPIARLPFMKRLSRGRTERTAEFLLARGHNRALLTEHRVQLGEQGIAVDTDVASTTISWRGVERVESNDTHIFILCGPASYMIIPRRAFTGPAEADAFNAFAVEQLGKVGAATGDAGV